MAYHISSLRRLCSATSPGRVAKSASSAAMHERRFSILFLIAMVSCKMGWSKVNCEQRVVDQLRYQYNRRRWPLEPH